MTGVFLFAIVLCWVAFCVWLVAKLSSSMELGKRRLAAQTAILLTLIGLPVVDELIGGLQFRSLCHENAVLRIDPERAKGQRVRVVIKPANEVLPGKALRILHSHHSYQVATTGDEIASYDRYSVKGGILIRLLGISEGNAPLTLGQSSCSPPDRGQLDKTYGFTLIN